MRSDLLDAQAAVDWAIAQIATLQGNILRWQQSRPYELRMEPDPLTGEQLIVTHETSPLTPLINAEVGAMINSLRSSLDLLAAALARRNTPRRKTNTYFPIRASLRDFRHTIKTIGNEQWLSKAEITKIENIKPYRGGDKYVWPLAKLDNLRKHERLIDAGFEITSFYMTMYIPHGTPDGRRLDDKTILRRFPSNTPTFVFTEGNSSLNGEITFNEPTLGLHKVQVVPMIREFAKRCAEIIAVFDLP
jgi:hypothetical protein